VIVQWCVKGLALGDDAAARRILDEQNGLVSRWWLDAGTITPQGRRSRLTPENLNLHVNHFDLPDPTGRAFGETSPFISLSCGSVERDAAARTNVVRRARRTALWFGTGFGRQDTAYLFVCWVVLAPRSAVGIEGVAEEVRDLTAYRRFSAYQTEGEVTAKVIVADNQIRCCEKWTWNRRGRRLDREWVQPNPRFSPPETLTNVRELI